MTLVIWPLLLLGKANAQQYQGGLRDQYRQRIPLAAHNLEHSTAPHQQKLPASYLPWWQDDMQGSIVERGPVIQATLDELLYRALQHSAQVKVFGDLPLIRETAVDEAQAAFDWKLFLDTRWDDISDPVGNILTTGGSPRYRDHLWSSSAGVSRRNTKGGTFETSQRIAHQNNNSNFFQPNNQGTSRWNVNYTQPLLRGAGEVYNKSLIVLADIDASVSNDEFSRQLQSHLLEIARAYWALYLERGSLLQKQRLLERAEKIESELRARASIDTVQSQLIRTEAAVFQRRSELVRAQMAIRNSQDRLNALINDPELALTEGLEIVPVDRPTRDHIATDPVTTLSTALDRRPELNQSLRQIRAASVRLGMSRNELLPQLDVVLDAYVSGLRGNSDIGGAWVDQFSVGEPSYSAALTYEVPIGRRAAKARLRRRQLELRQLQNQFKATVETLMLEVKVAIREVETGYQDMLAKYQSMRAAGEEVDYIEGRWRRLGGEERSVNLYLEDLLRAQERLAATEFAFLEAETTYGLSLINLKRADGTLLEAEHVEVGRGCENCLPTTILDKTDTTPTSIQYFDPVEVEQLPVPAPVQSSGPASPSDQRRPTGVSSTPQVGQGYFGQSNFQGMIEDVHVAEDLPHKAFSRPNVSTRPDLSAGQAR